LNSLNLENKNVVIVKVDCSVSQVSCKKFDSEKTTIPSLKIFQNGIFLYDYKGNYEHEDFANYILSTISHWQQISLLHDEL
jgi:hypothetical protein